MRTYENLLLPVDEWFITSTIILEDDGRFRYHESWSCYAGSTSGHAEGSWRRTESAVVLETDRIEGALRLGLAEGQKFEAIERGDCLDLGNGFTMSERHTLNKQ
jgi:hypothetical protein